MGSGVESWTNMVLCLFACFAREQNQRRRGLSWRLPPCLLLSWFLKHGGATHVPYLGSDEPWASGNLPPYLRFPPPPLKTRQTCLPTVPVADGHTWSFHELVCPLTGKMDIDEEIRPPLGMRYSEEDVTIISPSALMTVNDFE